MREIPVNILLVDDQEANLLAFDAVLSGGAVRCVLARSGEDALKRLLEQEFALVLLDVQMPGMDGFETADMIRARDRTRETPILFVTATSQTEEQVLRGFALGAVDYLLKPVSPELLRFKVSVFVELFRRRRQEAVVRAELARSNLELHEFAHVVAHDLQAPLRSVLSYLDLLEERAAQVLDEKAKHYLDQAAGEANRMRIRIQDLLAYARLRSEPATSDVADLGEALKHALVALRVPLETSRARVTSSALPKVAASPTLMLQLLQNLVDNAVKFRGSADPEIRVSAERRGAWWEVAVADNGIGIDPKDAERIFGLFTRLHTSEESPGTGIGLAICKKIAEGLGGKIAVESAPGRGATFRVTLPAVPSASRA